MAEEILIGQNQNPEAESEFAQKTRQWENWARERRMGFGCCHPCPKHGKSHIIFACAHTLEQEKDYVTGLVIMTRGYVLCKTCFDLKERHKFEIWTELRQNCLTCVDEALRMVIKNDPAKVLDLRIKYA